MNHDTCHKRMGPHCCTAQQATTLDNSQRGEHEMATELPRNFRGVSGCLKFVRALCISLYACVYLSLSMNTCTCICPSRCVANVCIYVCMHV